MDSWEADSWEADQESTTQDIGREAQGFVAAGGGPHQLSLGAAGRRSGGVVGRATWPSQVCWPKMDCVYALFIKCGSVCT